MKDYIETMTCKLEIGGADIYLHAGWDSGGVLRYLDLRLSNGLDANVRAALEIIVKHAKALVDGGVWTIEDMKTQWRGTHMDPSGICLQVRGAVTSPLDAAARYIEMKEQEFAEHRVKAEVEESRQAAEAAR